MTIDRKKKYKCKYVIILLIAVNVFCNTIRKGVNTIRYDERFGFWDSQEQTADQTRIIYV